MKFTILMAAALFWASTTASAQTEGRVSVGGSITSIGTTDDDVASAATIAPLVRLNPRRGWGPAAALNWFRVDLRDPAGGDDDFARLRVRPLMAGVSYTMESGDLKTSFSLVGGPSFNKADFHGSFGSASGAAIDADPSFAVRPGVGLTWTVAPRVAVIGFGGYLINRPEVTYRDRFGSDFRDRWKADAFVLSVGAVYSLF